MLFPGDKVRPLCDPTGPMLTVKHVSLDGEMVEMEEHDGWGWANNYISVDDSFRLTPPQY